MSRRRFVVWLLVWPAFISITALFVGWSGMAGAGTSLERDMPTDSRAGSSFLCGTAHRHDSALPAGGCARREMHPAAKLAQSRDPATTPANPVPTYSADLQVNVHLFYETDDNLIGLITNDTVLKSGQRVGMAFASNTDCYVHILWWDTSGQVGRLFPNPNLSEGTGFVKGSETHWLPRKGKHHWYVLDNKPGHETVYFVASRERNPNLEELYRQLNALGAKGKAGPEGAKISGMIEREINLMGVANYTEPKVRKTAYESPEQLVQQLLSTLHVAGPGAYFKWTFRHDPR